MQAVILCGGLGTRMGGRVKSLIPVRGRPFIEWQLERLSDAGFDEFIFCTTSSGGASEIAYHLGKSGWRAKTSAAFSNQSEPDGTAGALRAALAKAYLAEEFLVTYGDSFIDYRYGFAALALAQAAISKLGAVMTVCENPRFARGNVKLSIDLKFVRDVIKDEKVWSTDYRFVDYGAIAMRRDALEYTNFFHRDMNAELGAWARTPTTDPRGKDGGFVRAVVVPEYFHEIGSPEGLSNLEAHLGRKDAIT